MLLKIDGHPIVVWGVMIGAEKSAVPGYFCATQEKAARLARAHEKQFGQTATPVELVMAVDMAAGNQEREKE